MWSDNRVNVPILLIINIILLTWSSYTDAAVSTIHFNQQYLTDQQHQPDHQYQPDEQQQLDHHDLKQQPLSQARKLRRAVVPLMLGVLLKVSSIVPMKLMIMSLFALVSLLASKFALLLAFATGLLQDKSGTPSKRIVAISADSYIPSYHHGTSAQFSSSASGAGTTGFDTISLGSNTPATVDDSSIIQSAHKRRRIHNMIH